MKYIKTYEGFGYKWKNIVEKDGKLYIKLYDLANEMENYANMEREIKFFRRGNYSIPDDKKIIAEKEQEYTTLVRKLMIDKLITFNCEDYDKTFTGLCENVSFSSGFGGPTTDDKHFSIEYIHIKLYDDEEDYGIDHDDIIVYSDEDAERYKSAKKYNI